MTAPFEPQSTATDYPSICFVIPYFGKWPFWMPFFVESCRANDTVNWLLFSDCGIPDDCPPNIKIVSISYREYCGHVSRQLGLDFKPNNPYKLCDIKPALGLIHESDLSGFDFWAFGDIDVVYGNLRGHFTAQRLSSRDLLSTHARRVSGHCCIIRNSDRLREAFKAAQQWESILADQKHHAFDEKGFSHLFLRHKNWPSWLANFASSFDELRRNAEFCETFSTPYARVAWHDGSSQFPTKWLWRDGHLTNDSDGNREFPYFHFLIWKSREWAGLQYDGRILAQLARTRTWQISSQGFDPINC